MGKGTAPRKREAISTLVAAGADCFQEDRYGSQPWHYAPDEDARLLMRGPDFALHCAVLNKDLAALAQLLRGLDSPAQVNELGPDGNTPLHVAACVRCAEVGLALASEGFAQRRGEASGQPARALPILKFECCRDARVFWTTGQLILLHTTLITPSHTPYRPCACS